MSENRCEIRFEKGKFRIQGSDEEFSDLNEAINEALHIHGWDVVFVDRTGLSESEAARVGEPNQARPAERPTE